MTTRRFLLGATPALALPGLAAAQPAPAWRAQFPELVFAIVPAENATGVTERFQGFIDYMGRTLGTRVTLRIANDYAAVIEGQRSGNIHIAMYGPASFARALMTGARVEAFAIEVSRDGTKGYYSVFYVRANSPFRTIQDLRGRNLGLVDPNSTSGNMVPRFALHGMGINPEQFFGRVVYTGSHENAIIALNQGTVDVVANWWNDEQESNLRRMERRNMARYDDFRIIFRSEQIVNSPMAMLATLPDPLKAAIREAVFALPTREPEVFRRMTDGQSRPWEPVTNEAYQPIIELNRFVDGLRRQRT
ncbi:MAG: phosphonate ABC transporter substrate-binding protein [Rubritepida sp.]|jgi:phosphonate transport system substrate-binding protein|nr:phosphonate ABC transporter substrate-binding protein [Rubritepida sp.]